jgi:hypothetical protein
MHGNYELRMQQSCVSLNTKRHWPRYVVPSLFVVPWRSSEFREPDGPRTGADQAAMVSDELLERIEVAVLKQRRFAPYEPALTACPSGKTAALHAQCEARLERVSIGSMRTTHL